MSQDNSLLEKPTLTSSNDSNDIGLDRKTEERLEAVALAIWQARERTFPGFTRRMKPDAMDRSSGAWACCLIWAQAAIDAADAFGPDT